MVQGLDFDTKSDTGKETICESCIMGKQNRDSFDKSFKFRSTRPLELVHTDVCGQMSVDS